MSFRFLASLSLCLGLALFGLSSEGLVAYAQTGKIAGKVLDKKTGEPLIGANIRITSTGNGNVSDVDGTYVIEGIDPGEYIVTASYAGYQPETVSEVVVGKDSLTQLSFALSDEAAATTATVVIRSARDRQSNSELQFLQKNSVTVLDGISAETIRRSPDRNTGDVLKRVSGASIQGNRYVIVRGLNDRYNLATVNGVVLPSAEADRKAFSFDIFPASLLDNLTIAKTATPDLPGEFAGGIIQVRTRDIPEENFFSIQVGAGYNSQSTFKSYSYTDNGFANDWLGIASDERKLPKDLAPGYRKDDKQAFTGLGVTARADQSKLFSDKNWIFERGKSASLNPSFQFVYSRKIKLGPKESTSNKALGIIAAVNYYHQNRLTLASRGRGSNYPDSGRIISNTDSSFLIGTTMGALLNVSMRFNDNNRLTLKTFGNVIGEDQTIVRRYFDGSTGFNGRSFSSWFTGNQLVTSQFNGDHYFPSYRKIRLNYGLSFGQTSRDVPDYLRYSTFIDENTQKEIVFVPIVPSPTQFGRTYVRLEEAAINGSLDLQIPINTNNGLKVGGLIQRKDRTFEARSFGFRNVSADPGALSNLPLETLFSRNSISDSTYVLDEITAATDFYDAQSSINAAYLMIDDKFLNHFRVVWGARVEQFNQQIQVPSVKETNPIVYEQTRLDTTYTDLLPSVNIIYALNDKMSLRLSGSRTLSRPEFRELAAFAFYDFNISSVVVGNPELIRTKIWNADIRWETFLLGGQSFSLSGFYKNFKDPIEQVNIGGSNPIFYFVNIPSAELYGAEAEIRFKLTPLKRLLLWEQFDNIQFYANGALIQSGIIIRDFASDTTVKSRPMQGQSPYIINAGLQYTNPKSGLGFNVLFNRVGRRIFQVGDDLNVIGVAGGLPPGNPTIWEAPRSVLDLQISKRFAKQKGEVRLNFGDILNQLNTFYYDMPGYKEGENPSGDPATWLQPDGKYNKEQFTKDGVVYRPDGIFQQFRFGWNMSFSVNYRF